MGEKNKGNDVHKTRDEKKDREEKKKEAKRKEIEDCEILYAQAKFVILKIKKEMARRKRKFGGEATRKKEEEGTHRWKWP